MSKTQKGSHRIVSKVVEARTVLKCQLCSFCFSWPEKMFPIRLLLQNWSIWFKRLFTLNVS